MDTLSKVLDLLHFSGSFYYATNFHPPWSIEVPAFSNVARFHYVARGSCWARIGECEPQLLQAGDIIIIPHGARQILSDTPERPPIPLEKAYDIADYNGSGLFEFGENPSLNNTRLVCGHFEFEESFRHPLIDNLPRFILRNENNGPEFSWLKDSLRFMSHTAVESREGGSAIIKRLSEVIFIQAIRHWQSDQSGRHGFLAALDDPNISKCLRSFHDGIAEQWSIDSMARESGLSRTLFYNRFKQYLDMTPMQYVTSWRMQNARQMLITEGLSIDRAAQRVGYDSTAAFSKVYKRTMGFSPGEHRRIAAAQAPVKARGLG